MLGQFATVHPARHYHIREHERDFRMLHKQLKRRRGGLGLDDGISRLAQSRDRDVGTRASSSTTRIAS